MRTRALAVRAPEGTIDTCGTGGDVRGTFNISTATAIVVAAAGVPVAKAGNRAVSSQAGSSDVMAALGLRVEQTPAEAEASLRKDSFAYLHAPAFHPGMRHAGPVRRELGRRHRVQPDRPPGQPRAAAAPARGCAQRSRGGERRRRAPRARLRAGLRRDAASASTSCRWTAAASSSTSPRRASSVGRSAAADHGLPEADTNAFGGGDDAANAVRIRAILERRETGPDRDVVALNAAASLFVAGRVADLRQGVELAMETIASGAAADQLERLRLAASPATSTPTEASAR